MACKSHLNSDCKSGIADQLALGLSGSFSTASLVKSESTLWNPELKQSFCSLHFNHTTFIVTRSEGIFMLKNMTMILSGLLHCYMLHELLHAHTPDGNVGKVISPVTTRFITVWLLNGWRFIRSLHSRHRWSAVKKQATTGTESWHVDREREREWGGENG